MIKIFFFVLLILFSGPILHGDVFGQTIPAGEYPFEKKLDRVKFLDAYFGTQNNKMEVNPGDTNVPLTVILANIGTNDITGLQGQLSMPSFFTSSHNNKQIALADVEITPKAGDIFSLTFFVNVDKNAKLQYYPFALQMDYSRIRESGNRVDHADFQVYLSGKSLVNIRAVDPILTSIRENHVIIEIKNNGASTLSGVDLNLDNALTEVSSVSTSVTNVENVIVLSTDWTIGNIEPNTSKYFELDVLVPDSLKGETLRAPMAVTYSNSHGDRITTTRMVDFYVKGLIDISVNNIRVLEISGKKYIAGDIVNEGNDDGLFGYVTISPAGDSTLKPTKIFVDEIEVESPVPFNIPVIFDGPPRYGEHEIEIEVRYKDALRNEEIIKQTELITIDPPRPVEKSETFSLMYLVPIFGIGMAVFVLRKKRYPPFSKSKN